MSAAMTAFRKVSLTAIKARSTAPTLSAARSMGGGHDDHPHGTFDGHVMAKGPAAASILAVVLFGTGAIVGSSIYQNKKHGFLK